MSDHSNETTHTQTVIPGRFRYGSQAQTVGSGTGPVGGMAPGGDRGPAATRVRELRCGGRLAPPALPKPMR